MSPTSPGYHRPETLEFTKHPEANRLIAQDPTALLIGWIFDQQIRVQQAFAAPLRLRERLGTIDARELASMDVQQIIDAVTEKPVLHRYGGNIGRYVHACMTVVVDEYDGDPERIWLDAADYEDLKRRIVALPGFGKTKAPAFAALLARRFGLPITGFESELFPYGSLSEVVVYDDLLAYQARKSEYKKAKRAAASE
jgi:uncharacterized HhH-GPD family protein